MANVDIFAAVEAARQEDNGGSAPSDDTEVLFVGSKQAGKSTIINNFLGKDEAPKPTAALEFRFARRSAGSHNATAVANLWELGGGTQLAELLKVVLVPGRLSRCMVAVTLDMSSPNDALATLLFWLQVRAHGSSKPGLGLLGMLA
jgi:dynein light intermediate chain 2